jgi:hypothetical protein
MFLVGRKAASPLNKSVHSTPRRGRKAKGKGGLTGFADLGPIFPVLPLRIPCSDSCGNPSEALEYGHVLPKVIAARGPISRISLYFSQLAGDSGWRLVRIDWVAHHLTFAQISQSQLSSSPTSRPRSCWRLCEGIDRSDGALINQISGVLRPTSGTYPCRRR